MSVIAKGIIFQFTETCNLRCPMCYVHMENKRKKQHAEELDIEKIITGILEPARILGLHSIVLTDGEPLFRQDIIEFIKIGKRMGFHFYLGTNGLLLSGERLSVLLENNVDIHISIDSMQPDTIKSIRGLDISGTLFANAEKAISMRNQMESHSKIVTMLVLQEDNIDEASEVIHFALRKGFDHIAIQPIHHHGFVYPDREIVFPSYPEEFRKKLLLFLNTVQKLQAEKKPVYFSNYPGTTQEILSFFLNPEELKRTCRSGQFIYIDSTGNIRGCVYSKPIGHIQDGLQAYLQSWAREKFIRFSLHCHVCVHGCS
jgi:MoaA/NifB/PqqE/SkfB family radical SAM enzyme